MGFQKEIKLTQNTFHRGFQTLGRLLETDCFCLDNVMEKKKNSDKRVWTFLLATTICFLVVLATVCDIWECGYTCRECEFMSWCEYGFEVESHHKVCLNNQRMMLLFSTWILLIDLILTFERN